MCDWLCRLRDDSRSDPRVLQFLEQENCSAALHLNSIKDLQDELCDEISSRWGELGLGLHVTFNPALGLLYGRTRLHSGYSLHSNHSPLDHRVIFHAFLHSCPRMSGQHTNCQECHSPVP
jgi:hypothetical protein